MLSYEEDDDDEIISRDVDGRPLLNEGRSRGAGPHYGWPTNSRGPSLYQGNQGPLVGATEYHVTPTSPLEVPTLYKWRWVVLGLVSLINLSNGMLWMTFSAISDPVSQYYGDIDHDKVNWLSIVFMVTTVPLGPIAIWLLDKHGLKISVMLAAWLNAIGALIRVITVLDGLPHNMKYPILMLGQTIAGCAQPFILFSPTKVAGKWFPEDQRTVANMIGSTANPVGIMLGNILSTLIVTESQRLPLLLYVMAGPAGAAALLTTLALRTSEPPSPPSPSASEGTIPFWSGLKMLLTIKQYWLLAVCYGGGMGLVSALVTITDQLLCPQDYSNFFSGLCMALLFGVGLGGAVILSVIVDRTKKFEEAAKIGFGLCAALFIAFLVLSRYSDRQILLAVISSLVGFFGVGISPICLELSVESSYPVPEGTSAGFLVLSGQIQAAAYTLLFSLGEQTLPPASHCLGVISTYSEYAVMGIAACLACAFIWFYRCSYRRRQVEEQLTQECRVRDIESRRRAVDLLS